MGRFIWFAAIAFVLYVGWQRFGGRDSTAPSDSYSADEVQFVDVEIYTTSTCGYCRQAKEYMDDRGIEYLEKNVESDRELQREFRDRGGRGVPYLFVNGEPMRGFNAERFEELLAKGS